MSVALSTAEQHLHREDVPRNTSVYLEDSVADVLLTARGWTIERQREQLVFIRPGGTPRSEGGRAGIDYTWERSEALALALTAEALPDEGPTRQDAIVAEVLSVVQRDGLQDAYLGEVHRSKVTGNPSFTVMVNGAHSWAFDFDSPAEASACRVAVDEALGREA